MARERRRLRPARPLFGYRDVGGGDVRQTRAMLTRAWIILAILIVIYLAWTLTIYLLEPGLR